MSSRHDVRSHADSFLEKLRQHVHQLLTNDTNYDQMLVSTRDAARRTLPAISREDGERIADFIIEQVCEERLTRKRTEQHRSRECKVLAFPGGRLRAPGEFG
ncbi:hypothetical protein [Aquamicrobium terrae]